VDSQPTERCLGEREQVEQEVSCFEQELRAMHEISAAAATVLDPQAIGEIVVAALVHRFAYRSAALYLLRDGQPWLMALAGTPSPPPSFVPLTHTVTQTGQATTLPDESALGAPLGQRGDVFGALVVAPHRHHTREHADGRDRERELATLAIIANYVAIALRGAFAYQESNQKTSELAALDRVMGMLGEVADQRVTLRVISQAACDLCLSEHTAIFLQGPNGELRFVAGHGPHIARIACCVSPEEGLLGQCIALGTPLRVDDVATNTTYKLRQDLVADLGVRSLLCVPLITQGVTIGALVAASTRPAFFTEEHLERLMTFARQAALAIAHTRQYQAARDSATRLEVLNAIGRVLGATTDLSVLYRVIHEQVKRVMDATVFYIALYDEQRRLLGFPYLADGERVESVFDDLIEYPLGEDPTSWVVRERRPLVVTGPDDPIQNAGRAFGDVDRRSQSAIHMPMIHQDRMVGVISAQSYVPNAYSEADIRMLEAIASQTAVAIENAQLIQRLQEAYVRQRELDRLKDEFILTASHELRTPLATVTGYLYLLKDFGGELESAQMNDFVSQALDSAEQLNVMVNNLMDASRLQGEHVQVVLQPVALAPLARSLVSIWSGFAGGRVLDVAIPDGLVVLADSARLRQVLGNLLSNAIKYTPKDCPVLIEAEANLPDPAYVTVSVIDQGPGIAVGDQQRVFEKFVRLEETMRTSVRGTGLGLYICRQLVNAMGGDIWVESEVGFGAAFRFTLRAAPGGQKSRF